MEIYQGGSRPRRLHGQAAGTLSSCGLCPRHQKRGMRAMAASLPLPALKLHHFSISVRDLDESIQWYEAVLGMKPERVGSLSSPEITGRNAFLVRDGLRVELWALEGAA